MAPETTSPYQLDKSQILKASSALLKHIKTSSQAKETSSQKKNLLGGDPSNTANAEPLWLIFSAKKYIVRQPRLKPVKILLPHSLNTSPNLSICLITSDPQRQFKDLIANPAFSPDLSRCINRVIGIDKLKKKYYSFESKRQLRDSYDLFLADDRIITYLVKILGKTFYATTAKRPIAVDLTAHKEKAERKNAALPSTKRKKEADDPKSITTPQAAAREIERTLSMTQVPLSTSATTSIRVGLSSQTPEQIVENIEAVVAGMIEKIIPRQWRGVKAIYIKGPSTMALPVWLADELWDDESAVLEDHEVEAAKARAIQKGKKKRTIFKEDTSLAVGEGSNDKTEMKRRNERPESVEEVSVKKPKLEDEGFSKDLKERRERLREQKRAQRESNRAKGLPSGEA